MERSNIRKNLQKYIDTGDDKLLSIMYTVAKEYSEDDNYKHAFSAEEIAEFEARRNKRLSAENKTYSWEDAKSVIGL